MSSVLGAPPGTRTGLLLGAGGIRGSAHAGVITVLEEANIRADVVVGASIGSIFGAAYAAGWDARRIAALTDRAPRSAVAQFYRNRLRIDRSTYIGALLCELGENTDIEDLPRQFACMVLDRAHRTLVALRSGPLLRSLEASIALPGIARPVTIGTSTYVDGGIRGPVPASVGVSMGAQRLIRVELIGSRPAWHGLIKPHKWGLTRWPSLRRQNSQPTRSLSELPASDHVAQENEPDVDVLIRPNFSGLPCNCPVGVQFCVRQGRKATYIALA